MDVDDSIEGTPPLAQLHVHLALHVHEYQAPGEAYGHHDQLRPEGPLQSTLLDLLGGPFDEDVEGPHDAGDGHHVEGNRTSYLAPLHPRHIQLLPLVERFDL